MKLDDIRAEFNAAKHGGATPVILAQSLKTVEQTLAPTFQWGDRDRIYSLPGAFVVP